MSENTLNPKLYRLLKRRFNQVKVSNAGEAAQITYRRNVHHNNREEPEAVHPGEYYQVNCPYCADTRQRLYVNHMFGQVDDEGNGFWHLAHCFNENCLSTRGRVSEFVEDITELECDIQKFKVMPGKEIDISKIEVTWPGAVQRVDKLPRDHNAVQYLISRNFDPGRIGRYYNVHYCIDSNRYWLAVNRIIIPIYNDKRMIGWQARSIGEPRGENPPPKYYTCPGTPRRALIYNFRNARKYKTGVVVEGATDVWSFGPMACSTLGATMTDHQQRTFLAAFRQHSAILLYDPEEYEKPSVQKLIAAFSSAFAGGFAAVKLPLGTDPGSLDRTFQRTYVKEQAAKQGVKISWGRR